MTIKVLIIPGLRNSGPIHWQSLWQLKYPELIRVMQPDWHQPHLDTWAAVLDRSISAASGKAFLVAHSFGCLAALKRVASRSDDVAGMLLVAPADPVRFGLGEFQIEPLNLPTVLVASRNDPWLAFKKARALACQLGSGFVDLGAAGHINAESGFGPWPEGQRLLKYLLAQTREQGAPSVFPELAPAT